jgi:DNA-binding transcriptional LysR family regulator
MRHALRYLPTFVAVVEHGGVGAAAAALHKTQAAVSYDLKRLQEAVGISLLVRSGRRLRLTDDGRRILRASHRLLDHFARAFGGAEIALDPLRVASVSGFGRYVAHRALMRHYADRPIELRFFTNEDVIARVRGGDADFGLCFDEKVSRSVIFQPAYRERLVLIAPPALRRRSGRDGLKAIVDRNPAIAYDESDYVFARWFAAVFGDPRRDIRFGDRYAELEEAIHAVAAGRGYSIVPLDAARAWSAIAPLRIVPTAKQVVNTVFAVYGRHREDELLPAIRTVFAGTR